MEMCITPPPKRRRGLRDSDSGDGDGDGGGGGGGGAWDGDSDVTVGTDSKPDAVLSPLAHAAAIAAAGSSTRARPRVSFNAEVMMKFIGSPDLVTGRLKVCVCSQ